MRTLLTLFPFLFFVLNLQAQLIYTDPQFPVANEPVTIYFNASEGNQGLKDYTGDIYAHTGVITDKSTNSSDWKYVKTNWGQNTPETKLTRIETNLYSLQITPDINTYYGVPSTDKVIQLAFVFRSSDNTKEGKTAEGGDIYASVYEATLSVSLVLPDNDILVELNDVIEISAASNFADSLFIFIDNQKVAATNEGTLAIQHSVTTSGKHWISARATADNEIVSDSVYYFVRDLVSEKPLPSGAKKGINYLNDTTVTLVLHAPEKEFVYLVGDFNNWDIAFPLNTALSTDPFEMVSTTSWQMNKTPDGTHFWQTLTGLIPGKEYAYQYFIDGELKVADAYTDKILDPWNDKYINDETYPDLKPYPDGKTKEIASVFQTAQPAYDWEITNFTPPAKTDMVVYEMLIRDYTAQHTYQSIIDTLNYLQKLGVNVLELMPINEFEGNSSWGYNPSFYFAPDKYYGPKNDLKKLVDECHKRGIAVVIDLVLNHSYGQSPLVRMYFENGKPATNNPWYNVTSNFTNPDAQWGYDFNHESAATQALVDSINSYWMSEYNVDGFRFDFTKGFSNNIKNSSDSWGSKYDADRIRILKRMTDEIKKRNPDAFVIFEHLSDNTEEKELAEYGIMLWGNLNGNYSEAAMGYNENGKSDFSWISYKKRGWSQPNVVGYMESHDEERMQFRNKTYGNANGDYSVKNENTGLRRDELCANFFLTIPGPKMIWQFGELGYDISIDQGGRVSEKPILWNYYDDPERKRLFEVYSALAKLRVAEPAFETTDYSLAVNGSTKSIHLTHSDMNVTIIGNFGVTALSMNPQFQNTGTWYDYYTGTSIEVTDANALITLQPGEYKLYTTKKLSEPEITNVAERQISVTDLGVYPNPTNGELIFNTNYTIVSASIINLMGQTTKQINHIEGNTVSMDDLPNGIYVIYSQTSEGKYFTSKVIKQ